MITYIAFTCKKSGFFTVNIVYYMGNYRNYTKK
jgi:hypothetical protein